jgi:hypothetical protein
MGGSKGKLDRSKQSKAEHFVDGWVGTSQRLRSIAIFIVIIIVGLTFVASFLSDYKYFPKQPSFSQIQLERIKKDISSFHFHSPKSTK